MVTLKSSSDAGSNIYTEHGWNLYYLSIFNMKTYRYFVLRDNCPDKYHIGKLSHDETCN